MPNNQRDLLAIHPGALGDLVIFGHLLKMLGGAETLVAGGSKAKLLAGLGVARRAIDINSLPMHEVFAHGRGSTAAHDAAVAPKLAKLLGGHTRLVSCFAAGEPAAQARLIAITGCESASFLPVRPEAGFRGHLLSLWCDMIGLELPEPIVPQSWPVPRQWHAGAARELKRFGIDASRPYAVMHVGAGAAAKCWPLDRFTALAEALDLPVLMVIGEVELDRWPARQISSLAQRLPTLQNPPLELLAAALSACKFYVGNDSGVSHLAAAVGAPTLALFGATNSAHFAPLGANAHVIQADSMQTITLSQVRQYVRRLHRLRR